MITISTGFITNQFTSAFNIHSDTLKINNIDTGVPVDNITINPNDSYVNQNTKFGSVKVLWPHLSLTGDVQLFIKYITQAQVDAIERACTIQTGNIYLSFAGYMYRTENVDYNYKPNATSTHLLDMTLSLYGILPYSTPVFRPKFSTLADNNGLIMSSIMYSSSVKGTSYAVLPLPGISIRTKEDTLALLTLKSDNTVAYSVFSDIRDFSSGNTGAVNAMSNNIDQHYNQVTGLIKTGDGEDTFVSAKYSNGTIALTQYKFRYFGNSVSVSANNLPSISQPGVVNMYSRDNKLYVWSTEASGLALSSYDLLAKNAKSELVNTSNIHAPVSGVTTFPPFAHKFNAPFVYGLQDKSMLAIVNNPGDVNSYNTYVFVKGMLNDITGVNHANMNGILHAAKLDDNKLIIFPRGVTMSNSDSLLYVIVNFRNYNQAQNQYTNGVITGYKVGETITDYSQIYITSGYIQTNTAIISGGNMHMTTEAYTDYYKENGIVAMTLSTNQNKYYAIDLGNRVEVRLLTK